MYLFYAFVANAIQGWANKRYVYLSYAFVPNAVQGWTKDGLVIREVLNIFLGCKSISIDSGFWIMKMIFHILPQLRSHYLCQLSMNLVMLRYVS